MASEKLTPMYRQYKAIKQQYPDMLLLFRLGDFYECFEEDAKVASQALNLVLTGREVGKGNRIPMCGIPHHALERYLRRLLRQGFKVAVCEQMEEASPKKRLVRREVIRVLTPGTLVEDSMLEARANNFLVAIAASETKTHWGIAVCDVSTGEFLVTELEGEDAAAKLREELSRLQPAEILLPPSLMEDGALHLLIQQACKAFVTEFKPPPFPLKTSKQQLQEHFGVASLRGFGCEDMTLALDAACYVLNYLRHTHQGALEHIKSVSTYSLEQFMLLDAATQRNLELTRSIFGEFSGSLLAVLDKTVTPMGSRLVRRWMLQPLLDVERVRERLDAVEELFGNPMLRDELRERLRGMHDLERLVSRVGTKTANARDLVHIRTSLEVVPALQELLQHASSTLLQRVRQRLHAASDLKDLLSRALVDNPKLQVKEGGIIRDGFHPELDELRHTSAHGKDMIAALEQRERERTGIKSLKVAYNQVFGYYIEVTKPNLRLVPKDYHRKQTMVNAERFITPELKELESKVLGAEERSKELEYELFCQIRDEVGRRSKELLQTARAAAALDVLCCLAEVAAKNNYVRPLVNEGDAIVIKQGRHPVIEQTQKDKPFVPNDCSVDCGENQLLIITGPNMSGKSTWLRQTALIALMAQMGSFVPAASAEIGIVDRIFTRVGAHDDISTGQSTFMVEMSETANILHNATEKSLIIIDEIGRGTSTYDGVSIAWAVAEHIHNIGAKCLFATHYHHLNELEKLLPRVKNYQAAVKEEGDKVVFLYQIKPGGTDKSYGIQVARLAGLPQAVIERARQVLSAFEADHKEVPVPEVSSARRVPPPVQLTLFEAAPDPLIEELKQLDLNVLTPLDALNKLAEWKKRLQERSS